MHVRLSAALAVTLFAACAEAGLARIGTVRASLDCEDGGFSFSPQMFAKGWSHRDAISRLKIGESCESTVPFVLVASDGKADRVELAGRAIFRPMPEGKVSANWILASDKAVELEQLYVGATLDIARYAGGTYVIDGKAARFPGAGQTFHFGDAAAARRLELRSASGKHGFTLDFDQPTRLSFQDNSRFNSGTYDLRLQMGNTRFSPGDLQSVGFVLSGTEPLTLKPKHPVTLKASSDWLPFKVEPFIEAGSALDFSKLRGTDAPAGRHGRVVARGDRFEFEGLPGVSQRFYGVNFCFTANYVDKQSADRIAAHLARVGYNAVRFHHHDGMISAGKDFTELNPDRAKQFDGLVAACVDNGLYMTTDLYVSRRVPWRAIGEDRDGFVEMQEFKELVQAHEGAYRNYIAFSRSFLEHVNVYTGRRNADEPALAWLSLVNEGNLGNHDMRYMSRHACFAEKYAAWLKAKRAAEPGRWDRATGKLPKTLYDNKDPDVIAYELFLQDLETQFAARVTKFLREEIRSRQLTTNMNCWHYPTTLQLPRAESYDYVDDHFYVDHPSFLDRPWQLPSSCPNRNPIANHALGVQGLAFRRVLDRPFTITEYNFSGPGRYRGVGGIACGAMGALQGWSGLWRFAWSHEESGVKAPETRRLGYFDMAGDPLGLASERASICLYLRRDLEELKPVYGVALPPAKLKDPSRPVVGTGCSWLWAGWHAKIGNLVSDALPSGWKSAGDYPSAFSRSDEKVRADLSGLEMGGGALSVDGQKGTFLIRTPRTCGVFGDPGAYEADALSCTIGRAPATVWVSSLDDLPIATSRRLLLTHLTDVQNSNIRYADDELKVLLDWGGAPHLMRAGTVDVKVRLSGTAYRVFVLGTDGKRRREVAAALRDGVLSFTADVGAEPNVASYLYEIVAE